MRTRKFMAAIFQNSRLFKSNRKERKVKPQALAAIEVNSAKAEELDTDFTIEVDDPLYHYFVDAPQAVALNTIKLELASIALTTLKESGVKVAVPLVSQGELVGLIRLGERKSQQEYSR